ncbi:hypothetical protein [Streptomyces sp. NPDC007100]|uniref:hypothetical protein n=1 Tax=Streptomyces sp. NPDC007100 TaxID=3155602 RepID=UPI0033FDE5EA
MTGNRCGAPLRLLPWTTPAGGACYLSTDDSESLLSLIADEAEEELLRAAEEATEGDAGPRELRRALRDVLRIAVSRGARLVQEEAQPCEHGATERCGGKTFCCGCRRQIYL